MTEKNLRKALLGLDAAAIASVPDAQQITHRVLDRDRRWVRLLAALTILLWVTAALGIVLVLCALLYVSPAMSRMSRSIPREASAAHRERVEQLRWMTLEKSTAAVAISVAVLALAALGTVLLVFAAHAATIRRVNATLVEISERLKQLGQAGPP